MNDMIFTSIFDAAAEGNFEDLCYFVEKEKDDVNEKSFNGTTPLHLAALYGHTEIVKYLISAGADVNAKTDIGDTPLRSAVKFYERIIEEEAMNFPPDGALISETVKTVTAIAKCLISAGAEVSEEDKKVMILRLALDVG